MTRLILVFLVLIISSSKKQTADFIIADKSSIVTIYIDENSDELIKWAVKDLADNLTQMSGKKIKILTSNKFAPGKRCIYVGEVNDNLIKSLPDNFNPQIQNQWEKFIIKKHDENLFIVGSDIRGTVYGIFELAERVGISPWIWWADVTPNKKEEITLKLTEGGIEESPSVQYRGIFLNDEDWGLQPWAAKTFEPETGDIGPKTYEKIFQLLLRLKANTIWPAMHPCTKAFFTIPGNREMAEKYHISIGTSHAEPMLRNNVDEWDNQKNGDFNYFTNSKKIREYWQERITEVKNGNNIYSLGMRGIHDSGMQGNATQEEKVELLEKIIDEQRKMLAKTIEKPIEDIPQVFTLYKEVLDLYNAGLKVPDDVTLMWSDDNYGYIRRLSNTAEQQRKGGSGVYYHLSYWGRPHDYLWLSTTQPGLIWYEMTRAYQNGAQKIWIANVGDIKPGEYDMEFFLDLAWDINSINQSTIKNHLTNWCKREFGEESSEEISEVLEEYYRLAFIRKPEYMGWSQTEPTTSTRISEFSGNKYNNEIQRRIDRYSDLANKVENIKSKIQKNRLDSYFQLVEYPIKGAALMNQKFLFAQQSFLSADAIMKENLAKKSETAYKQIITLTEKFNNKISGGKWKEIMSMNPRNLPVFAMPEYHLTVKSNKQDDRESNHYESPIFIQAKDFSAVKNSGNFKWKIIEGLGYSNSSMTLFPFVNCSFTETDPYLEYNFNVEKTGNYKVEIRCIPTHSNNFDQEVRIEINDNKKQSYKINTEGRSEAWKINVLRNYVPISYSANIKKTGIQTLKISVNQTGIIIDQIAIIPENGPGFYEIIK